VGKATQNAAAMIGEAPAQKGNSHNRGQLELVGNKHGRDAAGPTAIEEAEIDSKARLTIRDHI